jgi:hypothetical protein
MEVMNMADLAGMCLTREQKIVCWKCKWIFAKHKSLTDNLTGMSDSVD